MARRRTIRVLLLVASATAMLLLPAPAHAVLPAWTVLFQESGDDPLAMVVHDGAGYVLMGDWGGMKECRIARVDAAGQVTWIRVVAIASTLDCSALAVNASGLYLAVNAVGSLDGIPGDGGWDAYVRKLDFDGNELWTRPFSTPDDELGLSIASVGRGVVLGGSTAAAPTWEEDAFLQRYDAGGDRRWTRFLRNPRREVVTSVAGGPAGIYAGITNVGASEWKVRSFGLDGSPGWTWSLGSVLGDPGGMVVDGDRLVVSGNSSVLLPGGTEPAGTRNAVLASVETASGVPVWIQQFGTPDRGARATDVAVGPLGVYVTGWTEGSFPPFENRGRADAFVRAFSAGGQLRWTRQFGTARTDISFAVAADATGLVTMGFTAGNLGNEHVEDTATFVRRWEPA